MENETLQTMADLELAEMAERMNWAVISGDLKEPITEVFEELIMRFRQKLTD